MNEKQREKIEIAVEVIANGHSKRNKYMEYLNAYDILKDYVITYDCLNDPKRKKSLGKIDFEVTEDTGTLINVIRILITSIHVKKEVTRFKEIEESEEN